MDRRSLLRNAGIMAVAGAAGGTAPALAAEVDTCGRVAEPATFVLVHGASVGGFFLTPVAEILRRRGHRVFTPTLTGLGERAHLLSRDVNLTTHVTDVLNVIKYEQIANVVLVGHSYGGMVIPCVADQVPDKIRSLVFLDAEIAEDGKSLVDMVEQFASYRDAWDRGEAAMALASPIPLLTPQPLGTFLEPAHLTGAWKDVARKTFVKAMPNEFPALMDAYLSVKDEPGWTTLEIEGPHIFPITMPDRTAQILEDAI